MLLAQADETGVHWKGVTIMRKLALALLAAAIPYQAPADDNEIAGTYKLVSEQRKIVDTGEIVAGSGSQGFISYDKSGRMLVVLIRSPRPHPENLEKMTDQDRIELFRTTTAYSGTYKFDGKTVEHSIDISWNGILDRHEAGPNRRTRWRSYNPDDPAVPLPHGR